MLAHRHFGLTAHAKLGQHRNHRVSRDWSWSMLALAVICAAGLFAAV